MGFSGPQGLRAIEDALRDIRREEDGIAQRLARATERVGRLRETEAQNLRDLAQLRLQSDEAVPLSGRLDAAEAQARSMLERHVEDMRVLETRLADEEAALTRLAGERAGVLETIATHQVRIDALTARVRATLDKDARYRQQSEDLAALAETVRKAEAKAQQARVDREQKGRPYREDPLFSYLWAAGFGTPAYKGRGIARMLDAMMARHIGYADARPNFVMLDTIPQRLAEHAEHLQADLEDVQATLDTMEIAALDQAGGKADRKAIEAMEARLKAIDAAMLEHEDTRDVLTAEQKQIAQGEDPTYESAISHLADALGSAEITQLIAAARASHSPQDDAIVARIDETRRRIRAEETEIEDQRARLRVLEARRRELEDIEFEYKSARYDDPRSRFGEDRLVGSMLDDFLKGAIPAAAYWGAWRKSQNWAGGSGPIVAPRSGSRRSGFAIPPGGFSPRPPSGGGWTKPHGNGGFSRPRGGFSGGGFRTGGGFRGGGGFRTGGKF